MSYFERTLDAMLYKYTDYSSAYLYENVELVAVALAAGANNVYTNDAEVSGSQNLASMGSTVLAELIYAYAPQDTSERNGAVGAYDFGSQDYDRITIAKTDEGGSTAYTVANVIDKMANTKGIARAVEVTRYFDKPIIRDNGDTITITAYCDETGAAATETVFYIKKLQLINPA